MTSEAISRLLLIVLATLSVRLPTAQGQDSLQLVHGDVILGAMFPINNIRADGCGDYDVDTLKEMMAVKWFLDRLNSINYIPGVHLGLDVYRTCQSDEEATRGAVNLLEKYRVLDDDDQHINTTTPLLGLLGPGRTQEAIVVSRFLSSLPSSNRLLLLSGSATGAELTDRNLYSNFFRVIPPDSIQVQVLMKLLQQLNWNYVSIVYDNDAYGTRAAEQLKMLLTSAGMCVPNFASLPLDYTSDDFFPAADSIITRLRGAGGVSIIPGVVFIGSAATARQFISRLTNSASYVRFIFSEALGLQSDVVAGSKVGKGALAAAPPYLPLPEFRVFWNNIWTNRTAFTTEMQTNSWLAEYYTTLTPCTLSDTNCWAARQGELPLIGDSTQWFFEYYQVKAAAVFASILKNLHSQRCGQGYSGVCLQLKQLIRNNRDRIQATLEAGRINLEAEFSSISAIFAGQTNVGFSVEGEILRGDYNGSLYNVFNYKDCAGNNFCFQQVAAYRVSGELQLNTETLMGYSNDGVPLSWPSFPKSQCMAGHDCLECLSPDIPADIVFVPGDFYIVAVAPVNDRSANSPLQCGAMRGSEGADLVQSVLFAVAEVNKKNVPFSQIFGTKTLGVVILNSCFRELVIKDKLIDLHKGTLMLPDGRNSSAIVPYIAGYVGAFFSSISVAMYEVLSNLENRFIIVSPTNTSPELSDRSKYPLFMRLTTGEDLQVRAILTLVRDLGHQYVQVIYDPDDVYTAAIKDTLNSLSSTKAYNICIVNNIASSFEEQRFYSVLDDLKKNQWVPLVVIALQAEHTRAVLRDILPQMTSSDNFRFLGTDGWARKAEMLTVPGNDRLLGSLVFSVELPLNQLFSEDLRNTDPLRSSNPWLRYFWEARGNCYFEGSYERKDKTGQCGQDLTRDYQQDTWVPFYINAVYAFALGLDSAMNSHCDGQAYLCEALTSQNMVDAFKAVRLDLYNNGVQVNVFDSNSDGEIGYKLYQVSVDAASSGSPTMTYVEVVFDNDADDDGLVDEEGEEEQDEEMNIELENDYVNYYDQIGYVGRYEHNSLTLDRENLWILTNLRKSGCPNPDACEACFPSTINGASDSRKDDSNDGALIGTVVVICILIIVLIVLVVVLVLAMRKLNAQRRRGGKAVFSNPLAPANPRPLPPIQQNSEPHNMTAIRTNRSTPGGDSAGSLPEAPNQYDYLYNGSHADAAPSRHSYLQPVGPVVVNASTNRGSSADSRNSSSDSSYVPPNQPSVSSDSGHVTGESGGYLRDVVLRGVGERGNSARGGSDGSASRETMRGAPLVLETEVPPEEHAPAPPSHSSDPDYLTPSSDYLSPVSHI